MTTAPTPAALAIADLLEYLDGGGLHLEGKPLPDAAADELRRLQADNERLLDRIHKLEMDALDLASENSILKRQEQEELEARKPLPLSNDDRLRLRSDVARAIWDVMREHEDRCDHALEDVEPKHQVWDCADAAIRAMKDKP